VRSELIHSAQTLRKEEAECCFQFRELAFETLIIVGSMHSKCCFP